MSTQVFGSASRWLRLADGVRLRREHFGGIAFDRRTGTAVDLDREAFQLLWRLARAGAETPEASAGPEDARLRHAATLRVLEHLLAAGILVPAPYPPGHQAAADAGAAQSLACPPLPAPPPGPHLSAPETVHWAVTYACAARCPDCYARRHQHLSGPELPTIDALRVVDRLADWGVFQLALGGGEPLERDDLPEIAAHARARGLVVHVTTGRSHVPSPLLAALARGITVLQLGINAGRMLADPQGEDAALAASVARARDEGLRVGANLMLSASVLASFERLLARLRRVGLRGVTLLRYKPPASVERWLAERPSNDALRAFEQRLPGFLRRCPEMDVRVDCALSFLQRGLERAQAQAAGIRGCVAADRILAVAPDGSLYACSQLIGPDLRAGNILDGNLAETWARSPVLKNYRSFRAKSFFRETTCGACLAREQCGGCRAFAHDAIGAEPECPGPLWPPLTELGPDGRRADLRDHLDGSLGITVGDYMARYGVGQERAVRELRAFTGVTFAQPQASGTFPGARGKKRRAASAPGGGKKTDFYAVEDVVGDLQDSIGCTAGGAPFASREEIACGLGLDHDERTACYPRWLLPGDPNDEPGALDRLEPEIDWDDPFAPGAPLFRPKRGRSRRGRRSTR